MSRIPRSATLSLSLVVVVGAVWAGLAAAGTTTAKTASGSLVVNMSVSPATLDPAEACGLSDVTVAGNVYGRLTKYGTKPGPNGTMQIDPGHLVPSLASSWTVTGGNKVYTFHLRKGMKFAGTNDPIDAAAVKFSFERAITMGACGGYFIYDGFYTPPLIKSIATPNATTVKITLSRVDPNVLQDWAQPAAGIVDPKIVNAHGGVNKGKVNTWMAGHIAGGSGPFTLQSYQAGKQAVLARNPHYYAPAKSKTVTVNFIASDPTLLLQARSGQADVTLGLTKQSVHSLASNSSVKVVANDTSVAEWIGLANNIAPFDNVKLRTALTYAIPYQLILSKVAFGYGTLFYGPFPPGMSEFNRSLEQPRPYDVAKAKSLIAASGLKTPIQTSMDIQADNPTDLQIATIVQGLWKQVGVDLTVNKLSASDYINKIEAHKSQSFIRLDGPGVIEAGYFLGYDMKCGVSFNLAAVCIKPADALLDKARATQSKSARQADWNAITKLWNAASPKIPVYGDKATAVLNKRVKSYMYSHEVDFSSWSK